MDKVLNEKIVINLGWCIPALSALTPRRTVQYVSQDKAFVMSADIPDDDTDALE